MRIGIDARYAYDHFPGIGRYVVGLTQALAELEHEHTLVVLHNPALPNTRHDLSALRRFPAVELVATTARPFSLAEQVQIPRLARSLRLDLLHSPYYVKPYFGLPCPSLVTIYDLIGRRFPQTLSARGRRLFKLAMGLALRSATRIIAISQSARDDLAYSYGIPKEQIIVTLLAADRRFAPQPEQRIAAARATYGLPPRYVLYLGSNKPHKNLERLVRAWERIVTGEATPGRAGRHTPADVPPATLVLAGHDDPKYPQARQMVNERGLSARVQFLPNVAEVDLPALYSGAELFVFPSYYEGFGLPPLEAMACGTPVACAYASSLPEVVGNAALTFDPYSFIDIADTVQRLLGNRVLRAQFRTAGLRRASEFSWRRTAIRTLYAYTSLAPGNTTHNA